MRGVRTGGEGERERDEVGARGAEGRRGEGGLVGEGGVWGEGWRGGGTEGEAGKAWGW